MCGDRAGRRVGVLQAGPGGDADDAASGGLEDGVPGEVLAALAPAVVGVLAAVDLDHQAALVADEVQDVAAFGGLSAELVAGEAAIATIAGISRDPAKLREEFGRKTEELHSVEKMLGEDFEHRDELASARARQAEIEALLDLDKATTGSQTMDAETA